ncbi:unnamed protein product [Caenorhabditis nigoni]
MGENDKVMTTLDDIPVNVDVELIRFDPIFETKAFIWSNQGKNIREWVQHFSSIFRCEWYEAQFVIFNTQLDIQSLRNTFPKLRRICINCHRNEPNHQEIQSIENILKAFLPNVKYVRLHRVPLQENLSIQHIGMTNLKELLLHSPNLKFDDILTMNVESCTIFRTHFSVRDVNHFFKLWKKGSYPRLHSLSILVRFENVFDWNILLKELNAEEAENSQGLVEVRRFIIDISRGFCAQVRIQSIDMPATARLEISKVQRSSPDVWRF